MPRRTDANGGSACAVGGWLLLAVLTVLALLPVPSQAQAVTDASVQPALAVGRGAAILAPEIRRPDRSSADGSGRAGSVSGRWSVLTLATATAALAALGAGVWLANRGRTLGLRPAGIAGPDVRVVSRTPLTPRHAIHVVRAGDRLLLLGTGTTGAPTLLGELPAQDASPDREGRS
jgi:flagellar biogenesis protein FliO